MIRQSQPLRGAAVGLAAGLVGAYAMELWQGGATQLRTAAKAASGEKPQQGEASTEKAADAVSQAARGRPVSEGGRTQAGRRVHYLTGAAIGAGYGALTELWPAASAGFGGGLALACAVVLDEAAVPALGLSAPPQQTKPADHLYGLLAHMIFGVATEAARRLLGGRPG